MRFNFVGINSISHPKPAVWPSLSQGECLKDNALPVSQLNLFIFTGSGKNPVQLGEFALADHLHSQVWVLQLGGSLPGALLGDVIDQPSLAITVTGLWEESSPAWRVCLG